MKRRTPYDRDNLHIKKKDRVLEVGPGHNPSYRADVVTEKFTDLNYHRCGDMKIYPHQKFVNADGENLPFKDKEFDYVICNQVLEHVGIHGNSQSVGGISVPEKIASMDYTGYRRQTRTF